MTARTAAAWQSAFAEISRVGPKGYIHGWIHVGAPTVGAKVFHPQHGHGTVTGSSGGHAHVTFASGATHSFESRPGPGAPRLEPRSSHERVTSSGGLLQTSLSSDQRQALKTEAKATRKRLSPAQMKTVEQWTAGKGMVRRIQEGNVSEATAHGFDQAMHEAPKVDGLVYRGVVGGSHGEKLASQLRVGGVMDLNEPVSTSIDPKQAASFGVYMFEIESPAAAYISGIGSKYAYEQEAVLAPGQYRVVSIGTSKVGHGAGRTGDVRIIRLQDVTPGSRSWLPPKSGTVSRAVTVDAADDDSDRSDRFAQGDGLGQFKPRDTNAAARAAGMLTNPSGTERLHQYWVHGEGAAKIRWGAPDDFRRCVEHLSKYIRDPEGYCNLAHHAALGIYPATHAKELKAGRADMAANSKKPYGDVKYADPKNGKYPIDSEAHCRAALAYISMPKNAAMYPLNGVTLSEVKGRIVAAAKKYGIEVSDDSSSKASASRTEFMRLYPLEDMHIIRSADGGDGRTVEAFAAVFGQEAEIHDGEGHYVEVIDPGAFNRAIDHAQRARGGLAGAVKVLYNHGMTLQGSPSERFSMPIGTPVEIRAEARGLLTRTRYSETPLAEEVLESIRSGAITSQSFTGRIVRSDPQLRNGDKYRPRGGNLTTVRRTELGLREYGPVLWPAYSGAEILGVRMSTPGEEDLGPDELDEALPPDGEPAAGDPPPPEDGEEHSARYHQHALYSMRSKELREKAGLVW